MGRVLRHRNRWKERRSGTCSLGPRILGDRFWGQGPAAWPERRLLRCSASLASSASRRTRACRWGAHRHAGEPGITRWSSRFIAERTGCGRLSPAGTRQSLWYVRGRSSACVDNESMPSRLPACIATADRPPMQVSRDLHVTILAAATPRIGWQVAGSNPAPATS